MISLPPRPYRHHVRVGIFLAVVFSVLMAVLFLLAGAVNLAAGALGRSLLVPWAVWGLLWLIAPATALVAGLLASNAAFLLRRLRTGVFGWCVNGIAVAIAIYAPIGAALYVARDPVGTWLLFGASRAEVSAMAPTVSFVVVATGAAIGTYIGMRQHTGSSVL